MTAVPFWEPCLQSMCVEHDSLLIGSTEIQCAGWCTERRVFPAQLPARLHSPARLPHALTLHPLHTRAYPRTLEESLLSYMTTQVAPSASGQSS